jgi:hypothetical protein
MRLLTRFLFALLACVLLVTLTACAAKGVRNQTRVGALAVSDAVLALNSAEQSIAAANVPGYDVPAQKAVGAGILKVLHAARAYERAAKDYPANGPAPQQLADAKVGINRALDDLVAAVPAIAGVREPLLRAVNVLRAALTSASADAGSLPVIRAQAIPPQIAGLFALANLFVGLIGSGRSTFEKLKATLQKEGATDEELDALDLRLSEAIAGREAQQDS